MPLVTRAFAQGEIFKQDSQPTDVSDGNIWIDTNDSPNTINIANGTTYVTPAIKIGSASFDLKAAI